MLSQDQPELPGDAIGVSLVWNAMVFDVTKM